MLRPVRRSVILLSLMAIGVVASAAMAGRALTRDELLFRPAADDGLRLLTQNSRLSLSQISPPPCAELGCTSRSTKDATDVSFTVVSRDTIRVWVYVVDSSGHYFGDVEPIKKYPPLGHYTIPRYQGLYPEATPPFAIPDGFYSIIVRAYDDTNRVEADTLALEIDRKLPVVQSASFAGGITTYRNGDTIVINAQLDRPDYGVLADFSSVDSDTSAGVTTFDQGDGRYEIRYTISPDNTRTDGKDRTIFLRFYDLAGNLGVYNALRVCLSNAPPVAQSIVPLDNPDGAWRNGETIRLETHWSSSDTVLTVSADFASIDSRFDSTRVITSRMGGGVYLVSYELSPSNTIPDGSYQVEVTASDRGCGVSQPTFTTVRLDNTAGTRPVLDPLPDAVRSAPLAVSGSAPGSVRVNILRNGAIADTTRVDAAGRFGKTITLVQGNNDVTVEGIDSAGNSSGASLPEHVQYITEMFVTIPKPFHPRDRFQVGTARRASGLRIELWTLGGDLARVLEDDASLDYYTIPWDGTDSDGVRINSGPLIAIFTTHFPDGPDEVERRAMILVPEAQP